MTLKLAQFCDDPKKNSTKSSYPQKIFFFLKTPKNIEIQNFGPSLRMCENIRVPPPRDITFTTEYTLLNSLYNRS